MSVNTGRGAYVAPGAHVLVRDETGTWPGYVVADNTRGDLWVRGPSGHVTPIRWQQVVVRPA